MYLREVTGPALSDGRKTAQCPTNQRMHALSTLGHCLKPLVRLEKPRMGNLLAVKALATVKRTDVPRDDFSDLPKGHVAA